MWKLSIEDDQGEKTSVNLVRDEYTIGRAEANTIRLTERNISREHARLFHQDDAWYLADRNSYNGVYVNGARVVEPVQVAHGDLIQLGDYRLEVFDEAVAASRTHPTMRDGLATITGRRDTLVNQPDRFVMVVGPAPGTEYPLSGSRMVVGRGEECDISINHASVSRVHAEVHALGDGRYELIDKGSANGVRVNAVELERALIDARDNIELGDVILKFIPAGEIYVPGADESLKLAAGQIASDAFSISAEPAATSSVPFALKAGAGLLGLGVLVLVGILVLQGRGEPPVSASASAEPAPEPPEPTAAPEPDPDPTQLALEQAERLLEQGDVFAAHAKVLELPEDSPARSSDLALKVEGRWADALLEAAEDEEDLEAKRSLLDQVAKNAHVDTERRKRAAELLDQLSGGAMEIEELPRAQSSKPAVALQPTAQKPPRKPPARQPAKRPAATPKPGTSPTTKADKEERPTLVRDDPFGSPASGTTGK